MTALAARRRLLERLAEPDADRRERELAALDRLMREPGGLPSVPEPAPLHRAGRDTTTEERTTS